MKVVVRDYGWEGARIHLTENPDAIIQKWKADELKRLQEGNEKHDYTRNPDNPWPRMIENHLKYFEGNIQVYDVAEGLEFETTGDY